MGSDGPTDPGGGAAGGEVPEAAGPPTQRPGDETFRLHPLTPFALGGRVLGVLVAFAFFGLIGRLTGDGGGPSATTLIAFVALAILVVVRGVVTVAVTRYHLQAGELRIDSGLLQRRSKRVRLNRVQSVDVLEPLAARLFGLAEVRVTTAGTERSAVRLRYLALPVARRLRADLLGRSAGADAAAPEAPEQPVVAVGHGRLVSAVLLEMISWRLLLLLLGPALTALGRSNGHRVTAGVGVAVFLSFAIVILQAIWRRVTTLWDFTVTESPDGLRIRHGLLSTSRQTVPPGRIQAILIHEPVAWRILGWAQIRMNVAGYVGAGNAKSTMLLPVADRAYASALVGWLLGGIDPARIPLEPPPRRAALRSPLWWRAQLVGADDHIFVARHGVFSRTTDYVPHERTQSVRLTSGPLQRLLGLATVHLDSTRGPVRTRAANRDGTSARALLDRQVALAQTARLRRWDPSTSPPR